MQTEHWIRLHSTLKGALISAAVKCFYRHIRNKRQFFLSLRGLPYDTQPLPKQVLLRIRSSASSFSFQDSRVSLTSSSS